MAESEKQLELKKRARRRLVGAAALALTAAIVLPMVMDHEPKPLTQDIQIRIPSQDTPVVPRNTAKPAPSTDIAKASQKPAAETASSPAPTKPDGKPVPESAAAEKAKDDLPKAAEKIEAKPDAKPVARSEPPAEPRKDPVAEARKDPVAEARKDPVAEARPASKVERESRVEAILSGNETPAAGGDFVVQLGAFSDPANAAKVRTRVKAAGYSSYTETLKGPKGEQIRVRAGPFASREAADQAAGKLKHAGMSGVVASR